MTDPRTASPRIRLKDRTSDDLAALLAPHEISPRLARRLQASILRGSDDAIPEAMPEVAKRTLERVRDVCEVPRLELVDRRVDPDDGFVKYLFRGAGPDPFEAVRIPVLGGSGDPKTIVCVSSQVGCALDCAFCATAKLGFRRNLETWEVVDQVVRVRRDAGEAPVRGVVFMGMGEPFANYERVIRAAQVLSEPCGLAIGAKAITISTVGLVPEIRRFTRERHPFRLVVSLTSACSEKRRDLLPIERRYPLPELREALAEYHRATRRRVTLAWTMMSGINTTPDDARDLARFTEGLPVKIDLIDVNDASGRYVPPSDAERESFRDALRAEVGCPVDRRYSGGKRIHAACGMLAAVSSGDASTAPATPS